MPIDAANVTPGVWEVERTHEIHGNLRTVSGLVRVQRYANSEELYFTFRDSFVMLREVAAKGYRFTARYVRCEGEPLEIIGLVDDDGAIRKYIPAHHAHHYPNTNPVAGLFIPQPK